MQLSESWCAFLLFGSPLRHPSCKSVGSPRLNPNNQPMASPHRPLPPACGLSLSAHRQWVTYTSCTLCPDIYWGAWKLWNPDIVLSTQTSQYSINIPVIVFFRLKYIQIFKALSVSFMSRFYVCLPVLHGDRCVEEQKAIAARYSKQYCILVDNLWDELQHHSKIYWLVRTAPTRTQLPENNPPSLPVPVKMEMLFPFRSLCIWLLPPTGTRSSLLCFCMDA